MPDLHQKACRLASVALLAVGLAACNKTADPQKLVSDARQYYQKGDDKSAIIQLKNALQENPNDAEVRFFLGTVYNDANDPRSAEKELRRALDLKADPAKVWPELAKALIAQGEFRKLVEETNDVPGANTAALMAARGDAQLALGKAADAKILYDRALQAEPNHTGAVLGQARLLAVEKNPDGALRLVDQVLAREPTNVAALLTKGDILQSMGNGKAAIESFRKAVETKPGNVQARLNLASAELQAGNIDETQKQVEAALKIAPGNVLATYMQGMMEFRKANYTGALEKVLQVLKVAPEHLPSVILAGAAETALGSHVQAQQHLEWALRKSPGNLYVRRLLGTSLLQTGQADKAIDVLQPGLRQQPNDAQLAALAGEAYLQQKDFAKATQMFEKATALDPKSASARTSLGLSRLASGDTERAMRDLESAGEMDSGKYRADMLLVMSHLAKKEFDAALKAVQKLEAKQPNNPVTYNLAGSVYAEKGDIANARKNFEKALKLQPTFFPAAASLAQLDLQEKKPESAKKRFQGILDQDKNNLQAMLALAELAARNGQNKEVLDWLDRANKAHPTAAPVKVGLVNYYLRAGDAKKAVEVAQDANSAIPDNPDLLKLLGRAQFAARDSAGAVSTYTKLARLQPRSPEAQFLLANAQNIAGDLPAAEMTLKRVLDTKPDMFEAQAALAGVVLRAGRPAEAMRIAQQLQQKRPRSPEGFLLAGEIYGVEKNYPEAAQAYEKAYNLQKNSATAVKVFTSLVNAGKREEGEQRMLQWVKDNPNDLAMRLYLADVYSSASKYKLAGEQYEFVLKKQPDNLIALNNLAWNYYKLNDPRARPTAERAYGLKPDNPLIADTLGWILVEQGEVARGVDLLQKAVNMAPKAGEVRFHLAQALMKQGERDKARRELEEIVASGAKFSQEAEAKNLLASLRR